MRHLILVHDTWPGWYDDFDDLWGAHIDQLLTDEMHKLYMRGVSPLEAAQMLDPSPALRPIAVPLASAMRLLEEGQKPRELRVNWGMVWGLVFCATLYALAIWKLWVAGR